MLVADVVFVGAVAPAVEAVVPVATDEVATQLGFDLGVETVVVWVVSGGKIVADSVVCVLEGFLATEGGRCPLCCRWEPCWGTL